MNIPEPRRPEAVTPARMGPLAKLPLFLDLAGKRAVVAGGTAGAAWKAELLAAAGARVDIYAEAPSPELLDLVARGTAAGSLCLHTRPWSVNALSPAAFALCDAQTEGEARAFRCAAKAAGVLCNVIDKPFYCDVQFGAIVNRSPIVLGISTDGAAPVLAQALRRRIEAFLPPTLAAWGKLAKRLRAMVQTQFPAPSQRRLFWERFAARAFGPPPDDTVLEALLDEGDDFSRHPSRGRVFLVGAGPGDAELLTLKALRALSIADVILFDDLVPAEVLELGRREARRIAVGKRGGRASCRQDDINALMVELAQAGKTIVRLKVGDPMLFGRAGEEVAYLQAADVPVEIVPGISAVFAMAAALKISLTHRESAHSLRFVTGHGKDGGLSDDLDWKGLADPQTTLIVYMGGRTSRKIAERLIAAGLSPETPVVLGYALGQTGERLVPKRLSMLAEEEPASSAAPVLIGIGHVFEEGLTPRSSTLPLTDKDCPRADAPCPPRPASRG